MKNTFKYLFGGLFLAGLMAACSPEEFEGINEAGVPQASAFSNNVKVSVDQSINQVTLELTDAKGIYPYWEIETPAGKFERSTMNALTKVFVNAGDYKVKLRVGNRDGLSDGAYETTFHIDNTIFDFDKYYDLFSKGDWHIANLEGGHLACGPSAEDPTGWWSAGANEKEDWGVYDNELTFTADGKYTFNPGASGTVYVNNGVSMWPEENILVGNDGKPIDFNHPVPEAQNTTYSLEVDGDDLYLTFPKETYFPYIPNDAAWFTPRFRIQNITAKKMTLLHVSEGITWQFILTTDKSGVTFKGFTYNQENNIWKNVEVKNGGIYYADAGWSPYPDVNGDEVLKVTNQEVNISLPKSTAAQWQAQFPIHTNVGPGSPYMTSAKNYDFSCVLKATKDIKGVTVKLVETGENDKPGSLGIAYDKNAVFTGNVDLVAGEDVVFYLVDQKGVDIQDNVLQLIFDFGGCEEGTEVVVKNIVLIEHDLNTELDKVPGSEGEKEEPAVKDWDVTTKTNLWAAVESGDAFLSVTPWFSGEGWGGGLTPTWSHEGTVWNVTLPEGMGGSQWMGQFPINTTLTASKDKKYNFYCVVEADQDCPGVTIKLVETNVDDTEEGKRDTNAFFDGRHDVTAGEPFIYKAENVEIAKADAHALSLFFDFGGCPVGANVKISDIYFEEVAAVEYTDPNNLWKAVDEGTDFISVTPWFSGEGWGGGLNPTWSHEGNVWNVTLPEGMGGSQWMGQFPINTKIAAAQADSYNFSCTIEADNDCPGVTIKLVETNVDDTEEGKRDTNAYFDGRHDVTAGEPLVYVAKNVKLPKGDAHALSLFFDFGGCPVGTNVKISNITLIKL